MMRSEIYSEEHQKLREILKRERKAAGLRQQDVADKTNRSQEYISKFERGGLRLDVVDFLKFCEAIGCDSLAIIKELLRADFRDPDNEQEFIVTTGNKHVNAMTITKRKPQTK